VCSRARAPSLPDKRAPPVGANPSALSLSRSLPSGADLSAPVSFARALPLSLSFGPGSPVVESLPRASLFSLSAPWANPINSAFLTPAVDQRVRTRARCRVSRPRRPPTRPAPYLEPYQCPTLAPRLISHNLALSRALLSPLAAAGDPCPRPWPSSSPETAPSLPELRPEVRHSSLCPISLIVHLFIQFHPRRCLAAAVRRARVVAGQFSPV
jgi:hypothetical protein